MEEIILNTPNTLETLPSTQYHIGKGAATYVLFGLSCLNTNSSFNTSHKATSCKLSCFNLSRVGLGSTAEVLLLLASLPLLSSASVWCQIPARILLKGPQISLDNQSNLNPHILMSGGRNAEVTL